MREYYTFDEVWDMIYVATLGNNLLRYLVAGALSKVPKGVTDRVLKKCLFWMPTCDEEGCFISEELLRGKGLIALPEKLIHKDEESVERIILHEVAHRHLDHKSPFLSRLSEEEARKQEEEANRTRDMWLKAFENDQAQKRIEGLKK